MPDDAVSTFSDEPIQNADEDRLGRGPFVRRLAKVLNSWTGDTSIVVGLHAPWGEGKTSLINLLCPMLVANGFRVLRFSPWEWASRADLNDAFFDEIAVQLGHTSREETIGIAKAFRRYAARLKGAAKAVSLTLPLLKAALILCGGLSVFGLARPSRTVLISIFIVLCFTGTTAWLASLFPAIADVIAPSDKDSETSLEQIRDQLKEELTGWKGRVLVVVDDVDRLDPQQTADVLRLIKANGDLPRISYLLVGDRQVIAKHVGTNLSVDGNAYLEKIIQLSFDLPSIDQRTLNAVFFEGLNSVLDAPGVSKDFDAARWATIFWTCIVPSISSLRNVKRLLATLRFHFEMLNGAAAFEVNPIDLVALETMRLVEPSLYRTLKRNKTVLLDGVGDNESGSQLMEKALNSMLENSSEGHRQEWRSALITLFPLLNARKGGAHISAEPVRSWDRERRVCSKSYFDRYFSFGVPDGELSESDFQLLLGADARETFSDMLNGFEKMQLLSVVIERLRSCAKEVSVNRIEPLVTALFDLSDGVSSRHDQMFGISALTTLELTVDELLKRLNPNDVEAVLDRSLAETYGLKMPVEFVRRLWALEKDSRLEYPIDPATLARWRTTMVAKIATASALGNLMGKDGTLLYLHLWAEWGNLADASKAVSDALNTRQGTIEFLKGLVVVAHSSNLNKRGGTERPYIRHSDISKYVDPELVYKSLDIKGDTNPMLRQQIHPEIGYFEKALLRFRSGKSDDAFDMGEDDE
jgi:predicted KAP-like P-loop ATPase